MPKFNLITPDDNKISLEAKGVLSTMLNLPESDYHTAEELCQFFESDSLQTIRKALSELTDAGYLLCMNNKTWTIVNKVDKRREKNQKSSSN